MTSPSASLRRLEVRENVGAAEYGPLPAERMERIAAIMGQPWKKPESS